MPIEHKVRQGECISSIADRYGLFSETIWNDPANAKLKDKRNDPNILYPGDVVIVPEMREKEETGSTDQKHRFRRKGIPEYLTLVLEDESGKPRANVTYRLTIDGAHRVGRTNAEGLLKERIAPNCRSGTLVVIDEEEEEEFELDIGHLDPISDPITEPIGVQERLNNLGYGCGPQDGKIGPRTKAAIKRFQTDNDLEVTGELDYKTKQKIKDVHGT